MKLWQKISLLCGAILIAALAASSALLLGMAKDRLLAAACEQTDSRQRDLSVSFKQAMERYGAEGDSDAVRRALLRYCFSQYADSDAVLVADGETLYSRLSFAPEDYLPLEADGAARRFAGEIDGRKYYLVGSQIRIKTLSGQTCRIYSARDLSPVYDGVRAMLWKFMLVGLACAAVGLGLTVFLVRRSLRPLRRLQTAAASIAAGDYARRAEARAPDEVGALAESFNHMAEAVQRHVDELTATARRQQLFIGAVTHEFKTPLTGILLNADTLQNTYMSEDERARALRGIETQGRWLERLVQKMLRLLTVSREIQPAEFPAEELLERVRASTGAALREKGLRLNISCEARTVNGDMDLLQSALVNLVDNAAKASDAGQEIALRAYGNTLEVSDRGKGIPADALEHVTEPFFTADKSRSKKQGGAGLGLALVREIAQAHNARLEVESAEGVGTTVRIRFSG